MAKKSKLLTALDAHKGKDYEAEKRKKQLKAAERRRKDKAALRADDDKENDETTINVQKDSAAQDDFEDFLDDADDADERVKVNGNTLTKSTNGAEDSGEEDEDSEEEAEDEDDVDMSDLSASDLEDTVPHQRLTINNGPALLAARSRIALLRKHPTLDKAPFHLHNSLISSLPPASEFIPDPMDDLKREAEFYNIARSAALDARKKLKAEGIPFSRPADYFAEMVKTETHMDKIKNKARHEASERKGREEARRQRDARKFGKQVQQVKEEERARTKRDTLVKIKDLKRKRKGNLGEDVREDPDNDMFERIDVEKSAPKDKSGRERGGPPGAKRQKRDAKFGFGGKKRFSKSGDAKSSGDLSGFSASKMKGKGKPKRLGKSRRTAGK